MKLSKRYKLKIDNGSNPFKYLVILKNEMGYDIELSTNDLNDAFSCFSKLNDNSLIEDVAIYQYDNTNGDYYIIKYI